MVAWRDDGASLLCGYVCARRSIAAAAVGRVAHKRRMAGGGMGESGAAAR